MISELLIFLIVIFLFKVSKVKLESKKVGQVLSICFFIPYIIVAIMISIDSFVVIDVTSSIKTKKIELYNRDGYIGECNDNEYIIYQEKEDLKVSKEEVKLSYDDSLETSDIVYANIQYSNFYSYKNKYAKFLAKDLFFSKIVDKKNKALDTTKKTIRIYSIRLNDKNILKGVG